MPALTLIAQASRGFAALDWAVLGVYLALLIGIGAWASRRKETAGDFFLGGRSMPVWAVALSVIATATSAATFIGGPEAAYVGNLTYLSTNIGTALAVVIVAVLFIPAFYRHNVTTVYDLLAVRFGPGARTAASWTFMVGRIFASGSRLFAAALPASLILFDDTQPSHMFIAIAAITAAGVLTALGGGIRSVIWTDVMQVGVFLLAAGAALWVLLSRIPLPLGEIVSTLGETQVQGGSKLTIVDPGVDLSRPGLGFDASKSFTLLTAIFGFSLLNLAAYGTDHDLTQRMLTCRSAIKGGRSAILALLINLPVVAAFMGIGLLLSIYYTRPDLMGAAAPAGAPAESRQVFLRFILSEMPAGLKGLMLAGLFAVGVGSLNSVLAAMSATFVNDAYARWKPGRSDEHYLRVGRYAVALWGVVLAAFACVCVVWYDPNKNTILDFVLGVMTFAYAGLLGVFLTALCTRRGNTASAIAALIVGFVLVLLMQPPIWSHVSDVKLAFPWRLTIATAIAFAVCVSGTPREGARRA